MCPDFKSAFACDRDGCGHMPPVGNKEVEVVVGGGAFVIVVAPHTHAEKNTHTHTQCTRTDASRFACLLN